MRIRALALSVALAAACVVPAGAERATAFVGVHVVPMDREEVLPNRTVIVRGERIVAIGPAGRTAIPTGARVIRAAGKYLMPGLCDAHVHLNEFEEAWLALFPLHGVTTVRSMWGTPEIVAWRELAERGELLAPTIRTTGPLVDGDPPFWPGSAVLTDPARAGELVREHQALGYDAVKVYGGLSQECYDALLRAARAAGLPAVGHVPRSVGLEYALAAGQSCIEHLEGWILAAQDPNPTAPASGSDPFARSRHALDNVSHERLTVLAGACRESGAWNCPTLVVMRRIAALADPTSLRARPQMALVPPALRADWAPEEDFRFRSWTDEHYALAARMCERNGDAVRALARAGAGILLGTDTPNPFVIPGWSVHEELALLAEAGLTPYAALRSATAAPAEAFGEAEIWGCVAVGRRADLLLLDENPLDDVAHASRLAGVMTRGRWLDRAELEARKEGFQRAFAGNPD